MAFGRLACLVTSTEGFFDNSSIQLLFVVISILHAILIRFLVVNHNFPVDCFFIHVFLPLNMYFYLISMPL